MLVAVAAMTFTACEKDNNEANKAEQKTVINGVATIENDDTRSSFLPKEQGATGYASQWDGNEQITVFAGEESVSTTVDSEGNFTATFEGEVNAITVCSPAYQWSDANTFDVPYYQVPLANSVDTGAHILKSEETVVNIKEVIYIPCIAFIPVKSCCILSIIIEVYIVKRSLCI